MDVHAFMGRWVVSRASERKNKDLFLAELCDVLGVERPKPATGDPLRDHFVFEADAILLRDGKPRIGRMDLYKEHCFILEAKQGAPKGSMRKGTAVRETAEWSVAMMEAYAKATQYARTLHRPPPFIITCDIGHCFDVFAAFDAPLSYRPFPHPERNRLMFRDLPEHISLLRKIFTDPFSLDPRHHALAVTEEVGNDLADLALKLAPEHDPDEVAEFLMRCIFTMFAQSVRLLPDRVFSRALDERLADPEGFPDVLEALWRSMNDGTQFGYFRKLLRFNGGMFKDPRALPLRREHMAALLDIAERDWAHVEPAIFGTLFQDALSARERHRLGAHFTTPEFVERVVRPTVEQPLRDEWELTQAQVRHYVEGGDVARAQGAVRSYLRQLSSVRVLDPACGSGNFLYVSMSVMKRLESEAIALLRGLGDEHEAPTVTPAQFLGIETKRWAKEIAELVLWIGFLQWHYRTHPADVSPREPILRDYKNVAHRDALIRDGRRTTWPDADFIVGNPPYLGARTIREHLGSEAVDRLRRAYPEVPETADLVMYWWHKAAQLVGAGKARRFGLITTKAIVQEYSRGVIEAHLATEDGVRIAYAIPNHPWVDPEKGADVRVAFTVCVPKADTRTQPILGRVVNEDTRSRRAEVVEKPVSTITAMLTDSIAVTQASPLRANDGLCFQGVVPANEGFKLTPDEVKRLGYSTKDPPHVLRPYVIGRDLVRRAQPKFVVDFFGHNVADAEHRWPKLVDHL